MDNLANHYGELILQSGTLKVAYYDLPHFIENRLSNEAPFNESMALFGQAANRLASYRKAGEFEGDILISKQVHAISQDHTEGYGESLLKALLVIAKGRDDGSIKTLSKRANIALTEFLTAGLFLAISAIGSQGGDNETTH